MEYRIEEVVSKSGEDVLFYIQYKYRWLPFWFYYVDYLGLFCTEDMEHAIEALQKIVKLKTKGCKGLQNKPYQIFYHFALEVTTK